MIRKLPAHLLLAWSTSQLALHAAPIQNLKFTDVVKDVSILNVATKKETPAKVGDVLSPPNVIKTGVDSRAELVAEDKTVTRVGANTIFSVEANSRDVNLSKGSVMFHSPTGKGGGNIKSAGATASVLGTTLIVGASQQGGFKVMLLEGKGQVSGAGGSAVKLNAGQMSFAMPGQAPSKPLNFELKGQVSGSKLVGGFSKPIASIAKIEAAIATQQAQISGGQLATTGLLIGDSPSSAFKVDSAVVQNVVTLQRERIVQQINPSRSQLDPRYAKALEKPLSITSSTAPEEHLFTINIKTGVNAQGYGNPLTVKGGRERDGSEYTGGKITILLGSDVTISATPPENYVLVGPFVEKKDFFGIVSIQDINITESVQLPHPAEEDGKLLLLSAGRTLSLAPGKHLSSGENIPVFDIYTEGYKFSDTLTKESLLTAVLPPVGQSKVGLEITGGGQRIENPTDGGHLRISAPSMKLENVDLFARSVGGKLELEARDGDLQIGTAEIAGLNTVRPSADTDPGTDVDSARPNLIAAELIVKVKGRISFLGATVETSGLSLVSESTEQAASLESIVLDGSEFSGASLGGASTDFSYSVNIDSAGSVRINRTALLGAPALSVDSGAIISISDSDLSSVTRGQIQGNEVRILNTTLPELGESKDFDLPIGFSDADQLALSSPKVSVRSTAKAITLRGVYLASNDIQLKNDSADQDLTLARVYVTAKNPVNDSTLSVEGKGKIVIGADSPSTSVVIDGIADVNISNESVESIQSSIQKEILMTSVAIRNANSVKVAAEHDVTFANVSVSGPTRVATRFFVSSKNGNVLLDGDKLATSKNINGTQRVIQSKKVSIVSRVAIDEDGVPTQVTGTASSKGYVTVRNHSIKAETVHIAANEQISLSNVNFEKLSEAQAVNMTANTTVLKDVSFADGSTLHFKVGGFQGYHVAGNAGFRSSVQPGLLNVMSNVKYGNFKIEIPGSDTAHMTGTQFTSELQSRGLTNAAQKISVGNR